MTRNQRTVIRGTCLVLTVAFGTLAINRLVPCLPELWPWWNECLVGAVSGFLGWKGLPDDSENG